MHVQPVSLAGGELGGGEGHADTLRALLSEEVQERAPTAAQIEDAPAGLDAQLFRDVLVLSALRLLEGEAEVAVELRAAEVCELAHAEPEDPVRQRVGEVDVAVVGHLVCGSAAP